MKQISILKLFLIFSKIGAILLGGGYVILPILVNEFVKKKNLISEEELLDYFALSQALPGIIASNISMFVGYKLRGKIGAFVAMIGVVTVPILSIILLATILTTFAENKYVQSVFGAIGVAVIALILLTICEIWQKATKDKIFFVIFVFALILLLIFNLSPIKTILLSIFLGILLKILVTPKEAR